MRVLYFSKGYTPHDYRFLAALAGSVHTVFYLRLEGDQRQTEDRPVPSSVQQIHWAGGKAPFHWRDVPRLTLDLSRVIRRTKPDLVHAGPVQTCAFLTALTGFHPLLTMSWGFDLLEDAEKGSWLRGVTRYTLKRSDFFVSDAQASRHKAVRFGMQPDRTDVFPWGVDLQHFAPEAAPRNAAHRAAGKRASVSESRRARSSAAAAPFVVFCNRSWESRYGIDVLARAFVRVASERPNVSLILLSGGSLAQSIRRILMSGHALERVQFGGQISQSDLPRWYHMADLYISASHVDGSSVSLMEALACGLPVLVSDIPANREWVFENANGWLFPDGNVDALAEKIMEVMGKRDHLDRIRKAARKSAVEHADWSKNFKVLLEAYERAVKAA